MQHLDQPAAPLWRVARQHGLELREGGRHAAKCLPLRVGPRAQRRQAGRKLGRQANIVLALPVELGQRRAAELGAVFQAHEPEQPVALDQRAARRQRCRVQARHGPRGGQPGVDPVVRANMPAAGRGVGKHFEPEQRRPVDIARAEVVAKLFKARPQIGVHSCSLAEAG